MKPRKIKARKMWAFAHLACYAQRLAALCYCKKTTPVYVLPADAASVEAMVEQMGEAMCKADFSLDAEITLQKLEAWRADSYRKQARAALAAIGIK